MKVGMRKCVIYLFERQRDQINERMMNAKDGRMDGERVKTTIGKKRVRGPSCGIAGIHKTLFSRDRR